MKPTPPSQVAKQLQSLKALRHWIIKPGRKRIKLYYPKAHKRYAERFRQQIDVFLKQLGYVADDCQILLYPKQSVE